MTAATLFSGIGAPEVAMPQWDWIWHAEIEKFPAAVMAERHPSSVNLGDVTADDFIARALSIGRPDVLIFGSPCQSFSVAGKRLGLDDPRGNLAIVALGLVHCIRPEWFVFENVPGLLSSDGGNDFRAFLRLVGLIGYSCAWTILDAQFAGLAQRRRRVFVVGRLGDEWRGPAAILLEPESVCGHPPTREAARQDVTGTISSRSSAVGGLGTDFDLSGGVVGTLAASGAGLERPAGQGNELDFCIVAPTISPAMKARDAKGASSDGDGDGDGLPLIVTHTLRSAGFDASEDGTGRGTPLVPIAFNARQDPDVWHDRTGPLDTDGSTQAVAYSLRSDAARDGRAKTPSADAEGRVRLRDPGFNVLTEQAPTVDAGLPHFVASSGVRRLMPVECERLQGFPDDYTAIAYRGKPAADGPRYKAIGNSMAVPVVRWILTRLEFVHGLQQEAR